MPLKEYQSTSYPDLMGLLNKITEAEDAEVFIFFSCTLDKHGDPTTKACFESEDLLMEYTEFIRGSTRSLHLIYFRMQLEAYYVANTEIGRDRDIRVTEVPTLMKWRGYQRLTGRQCGKIPLLSMVFEKECPTKFPVFKPCYYFGKSEPPQAAGNSTTGSKQAVDGESGSRPQNVNGTSNPNGNNGSQIAATERVPEPPSDPISEKPSENAASKDNSKDPSTDIKL